MLKDIVDFFKNRLQAELPYHNIENENLDEQLKQFILQQQNKPSRAPRSCAVMLALFPHEGEIYIPCILRPQKSRVHAGQVAFPGGGREETDRHLTDTATRETWEEIGVNVPESNILGDLTNIFVPPSHSLITPKVAFLDKKPSYNIDPNEVDRIIEIPISHLLNIENHIEKIVAVQKNTTIRMPAIKTGEFVVWGATARILKEFTLLLQESKIIA